MPVPDSCGYKPSHSVCTEKTFNEATSVNKDAQELSSTKS
jgi:hypothetical protein